MTVTIRTTMLTEAGGARLRVVAALGHEYRYAEVQLVAGGYVVARVLLPRIRSRADVARRVMEHGLLARVEGDSVREQLRAMAD